MKTTQAIPYVTLSALVAIAITGVASLKAAWTTGVQASYFLAIATLLAALAQLLISAGLHAIRKFDNYWHSGYPILSTALLTGYVIFKSIPQPAYAAISIFALVSGWVIASKLPKFFFRIAPLLVLLFFLFTEEALNQVYWRHWITSAIIGALLYPIQMHRRGQ